MTDEHDILQFDGDLDGCKVFITRIPKKFDETTVKRLLEDKLESNAVVDVALVPKKAGQGHEPAPNEDDGRAGAQLQEHRGFAFATLKNSDLQKRALLLGTVRGGVKPTSTKKFTLYISAVVRDDNHESSCKQICFLWSKFRCPYGVECKFIHEGNGACLETSNDVTRKRKKCFAFKKGKCKLGDQCPNSHDFEVTLESISRDEIPLEEKDCINWKTKGKCRKGADCPYRHDESLLQSVLAKKKRKANDKEIIMEKKSQPLCVRVFGLNYDTSEKDVRDFFAECGKIAEVTFPKFDDSGRSKGYCGVLFQSPKAVATAVAMDGKELQGRWLRIQAGKMYLKQWEQHHQGNRKETANMQEESASGASPLIGEFGQKVKRRRKHGYKE